MKRFVLVQKIKQTAETDENRSPNTGRSPAAEMTFQKNKVRCHGPTHCQNSLDYAFSLTLATFQSPVVLSQKLKLDQYVATTTDSSTPSGHPMEYSIRSIVHHIGSTANSGHYTADAMRFFPDDKEKPNQWMSFDDGITMHAGNDVLTNVSKQKTAYMLLYTTED